MNDTVRKILLGIVIIAIGGTIFYVQSKSAAPKDDGLSDEQVVELGNSGSKAKDTKYERAKELVEPNGFINTDGITLGELVGKKVILVDFWTYSCINCQRTTPFLNSWYDKYRDKGLEIIGVHTPEFDFEKKYENVVRAVEKFEIEYPVVQDNDYKTWRAYKNRYWPRKYLIDIDGFIVYDHIGEGAYEETERKIQELLKERMTRLGESGDIEMELTAEQKKSGQVGSPEVYFGALRNELLTNGRRGQVGKQINEAVENPETNRLYLVGAWDIQEEYAQNDSERAKVVFLYGASNVFTVAAGANGKEVVVEVLRDGKPIPEAVAGDDIYFENGKSYMKVSEEQLYTIIKDPEGFGAHILTLIPQTPGLQMFTFTFG
ncbi:thiol-disulfide isomerase [Candidatus Peregrinibacteria bacterium CG11_big_fil_rev_8_21_14_0_20_46_8]|nr:MAG: thiol-disulfide isomerase [Candidatus Peregrinibacteria bacterium CG11_big_fil_rev_8_21_14_0_20_46_8]